MKRASGRYQQQHIRDLTNISKLIGKSYSAISTWLNAISISPEIQQAEIKKVDFLFVVAQELIVFNYLDFVVNLVYFTVYLLTMFALLIV